MLCACVQALVPVTEEVPVAVELHRFIIGSKGRDVRQMMDEFEVSIQVPPADDNIAVLQVTGAPSNVARAKQALLKRVRQLEDEQEQRVRRLLTYLSLVHFVTYIRTWKFVERQDHDTIWGNAQTRMTLYSVPVTFFNVGHQHILANDNHCCHLEFQQPSSLWMNGVWVCESFAVGHSRASWTAEWIRCRSSSSLVCEQLPTMWNIVCCLLCGHWSVVARLHFVCHDAQWRALICKQFISDQWCRAWQIKSWLLDYWVVH